MLALSTMWNAGPVTDAAAFVSGVKKLGFGAIEVGHDISPETVAEAIHLVGSGIIRVVSVHNYCPLPPKPKTKRHKTDYYRLSSLDEEERRKAVEYTKITIDTAVSLMAEVVVLHAGAVELEPDPANDLIGLYRAGRAGSDEYKDLRDRLLALRNSKKGPFVEAAMNSMNEIINYAVNKGVKVGLETRYYPQEIPDHAEIACFLDAFGRKGLYYWHDAGHAEVAERLGIKSHADFFKSYADRMIGMHIHDLAGIDDHKSPFTGDFDFSKITGYLRDDVIKVIEAHAEGGAAGINEKEISKRLSVEHLRRFLLRTGNPEL